MLRVQQQLCLIVLTFFIAHTVSESKISVVDIGADPGDIIFDSRHTLLGAPTDLIRRKRNADGTTTQVEKVASSNGSTVFECYQYTWPGINENNTVSDCPRIKKFTPCFTPFVFTDDGTVPDPQTVYDYCKIMGCKVTCPKTPNNACIRYSFYTDISPTPKNITYFCGAVQDTTDSKTLTSGDYSDNIGGEIRKVKFCQGDLCNSSPHIRWSVFVSVVLPAVIFLLLSRREL